MFRSELVESVNGGAQESALGGCEAFASLLAGYIGLWTAGRVMESDLQGTQIQIGQGVHLTGKAPQGAALVWVRQLCRLH